MAAAHKKPGPEKPPVPPIVGAKFKIDRKIGSGAF
ncbi:MAG: hypothetical protein EZS28_053900, partial [Streblomastix strix]